jgi:hypothetical protein
MRVAGNGDELDTKINSVRQDHQTSDSGSLPRRLVGAKMSRQVPPASKPT